MPVRLIKATKQDEEQIWKILQEAILRRKLDGSKQWQDGYPNPETIARDVEKEVGYCLKKDAEIIGYCAVLINDEPEYDNIVGEWLSTGDYVVFHRVAIADSHLKQGFASKMMELIENYALEQEIYSVKADTNFDNPGMLKLFENHGYVYCGKVYFRGSERLAFEKNLKSS